jgi:hypothetical protein
MDRVVVAYITSPVRGFHFFYLNLVSFTFLQKQSEAYELTILSVSSSILISQPGNFVPITRFL